MNSQLLTGELARADRRRSQRRKYRGTLEIEWGSATLTGTVLDISGSGLFDELTPQPWVGAAFSARLMVKSIFQLDCTVRKVEPGRGIALSDTVLEENSGAQLETLLAGLPPV